MMAPDMKIDLLHVTARRNKDGSIRYYFRRRGQPLHRLAGDPRSPEFMETYNRLLNWQPHTSTSRKGSFAWLCDRYTDSPELTGKAKATQEARRRIILTMLAEPIDPAFSETFSQEDFRKHVIVLRNRKSGAPNAANERLKVLSQIFGHAVDQEWIEANPVASVKRLAAPKGGHRTATNEDLAQFMAHHTDGSARRAMRLLMAFGMRVSDLRLLHRRNLRNGTLSFETVKSQVLCELPVSADLERELRSEPSMMLLLNEHGRPFASDKALSQRIAKWFRQADLVNITAHSVRKWLATKKAEAGATEYEMMAWFGWNDPKEARPYIQAANRKKLAQRAAHTGRV